MKEEMSRTAARYMLERHGFRFQKKYGQNFLLDQGLLEEIATAADVGEEDFVLEIGPGMGSLTAQLAKRARAVLAVEIDGKLLPVLEETLAAYDNITVLNADIMKLPFRKTVRDFIRDVGGSGDEPIKVVANLPYYITTPIVMRLIEEGDCSSITVMVQKEVATRMTAAPGGKEYGALSLAVGYYTKPAIIRTIPPESFYPAPKVESALVTLQRRTTPPVEVDDEKLMFQLIRAGFNQRRKTLVNGLYNGAGLSFTKESYADILSVCGIEPAIRGEKLSLADFAAIANEITRRQRQ